MECPRCHGNVDEGNNFCPQCGYDLTKKEEQSHSPISSSTVKKTESEKQGKNVQTAAKQESSESDESCSPSPSQEDSCSSQPSKPKGSIGGGYIAGIVVIGIICIISLIWGIITTIESARSAQSASQPLQSSSSSSSSSSQTDAQTYLLDAQNCSTVNSDNTLNDSDTTDSYGSYGFTVTGDSGWAGIMTCVAKDLHMPSSIQAKIRNFINKDVDSQLTTDISSTVDWQLQDGSSVYATYAGPLNGNGGWIINFNDVNPELLGSQSQ